MFSTEVTDDPFVLYHGTTWEAAQNVLLEGLHWKPTVLTRAEVLEVIQVFDALDWSGDGGSMVILSACTAKFDFRDGDKKPVFLAAGDHRARMYAKRRFAGGETVTGMRVALSNLRRLANEKVFYERYLSELAQLRSGIRPPTQQQIAAEVERFRSLEIRCLEPYERFTAGGVIAFRFSAEDMEALEYHHLHGVMSHVPVSPCHIVAVDRVEESQPWDMFDESVPNFHDESAWNGIIAALRSRTFPG